MTSSIDGQLAALRGASPSELAGLISEIFSADWRFSSSTAFGVGREAAEAIARHGWADAISDIAVPFQPGESTERKALLGNYQSGLLFWSLNRPDQDEPFIRGALEEIDNPAIALQILADMSSPDVLPAYIPPSLFDGVMESADRRRALPFLQKRLTERLNQALRSESTKSAVISELRELPLLLPDTVRRVFLETAMPRLIAMPDKEFLRSAPVVIPALSAARVHFGDPDSSFAPLLQARVDRMSADRPNDPSVKAAADAVSLSLVARSISALDLPFLEEETETVSSDCGTDTAHRPGDLGL